MNPKLLQSNLIIFSLMLFCLTCFTTLGQQSKKISLQGFLKDGNGKAVADGSQAITFKLYTQESGGTAAWTEDQTLTVYGGVYSTQLGKITSLENLNWGSSTYYVGVTVQGTELTPRTELTFAPYSLGSPKAQEVVCSGAVGDVKYSILNPIQFAAVNGSCWVAMDGLNSMAGSKLAAIIGGTTVPNAGGLFLRGQEFTGQTANHDPDRTSNSPIATFEEQAMQTHTHSLSGSANTNTVGDHSHAIGLRLSNGSAATDIKGLGGYYPSTDNSSDTSHPMIAASDRTQEGSTHSFTIGNAGSHSHTLTGNTDNNNGYTASETRPKNLNLWTYIRIN